MPTKPLLPRARLQLLAIAVSSIAATPSVQAAQALEEVVVTATKKAESLQDIALSVSAISGDKLNDYNIFDFKDVETLTPGLSLTNIDPRNTAIGLRGITFDPDTAAAPAVVSYWNGIPVRANVVFNQIFDLERLEILRGPQGTLQGETSPAGSIQLHSKRADLSNITGNISQTFSNNGGSNTQGGLSVPLIEDKLAIRIAGLYDDAELDDIESVSSGLQATTHSRAGRINLLWQSSDSLRFSLTHEYAERFSDGMEIVTGQDGPRSPFSDDPSLNAFDRTSLQDGIAQIKTRNRLTVLEANWELESFLLTSVSGYQENTNYADRDIDLGNAFPGAALQQEVDSNFRVRTQEMRLQNLDPQRWEYTVGLYYNKYESFTTTLGNTPVGFAANPPTIQLLTSIPDNFEASALFVDNKFHLNDSTNIAVGLRYQKRNAFRNLRIDDLDNFGIFGAPSVSPLPEEQRRDSAEALTGSLKLSHHFGNDNLVYIAYGRGYRPGGITLTPTLLPAENLLYEEETSDSIELGLKTTFGDGRYRVNAAIYQQNFDGFITRASNLFYDADGDGVADSVVRGGINYNGDAVVRGAEADISALLTDAWSVNLGLSYSDAKFDDAQQPCSNLGDAITVPGSVINTCASDGRIGSEPNWSVSAQSEYNYAISDEYEAYIRGLYKFSHRRPDVVSGDVIPSFGIADLYAGLRALSQAWEINVFARNLFDKQTVVRYGAQQTQLRGFIDTGFRVVSVQPQRTVGLGLKYTF